MDHRRVGRCRGAGAQRRGGPGGFRPAAARLPRAHFPFDWRIVIADNASTDGTRAVAHRLAEELAGVEVSRAFRRRVEGPRCGPPGAGSNADIVAYTDVDLSTGLTALLPLVAPLVSGHSRRGHRFSLWRRIHVARGPSGSIISRHYNVMLRARLRRSLPGCAVRLQGGPHRHRQALVPASATRVVLRHRVAAARRAQRAARPRGAGRLGRRSDSRVDVPSTAMTDLRGVCRVLWTLIRGGGNVELGTLERKPLVDDSAGRRSRSP